MKQLELTKRRLLSGRALLLVAAMFLVACSSHNEQGESELKYADEEIIYGLATPIQLGFDTTEIYIQDYFNRPDRVDSIHPAKGLKIIERTEDQRLLVTGQMKTATGNFRFFTNGLSVDIPAFKNNSIRYTFRLPDPEQAYDAISISGAMNGWVNTADSLRYANGEWTKEFILNPGQYSYRLWIDGVEQTDPSRSDSISNGFGGYNSFFTLDSPKGDNPWARPYLGEDGSLLIDVHGHMLCYWQNHLISNVRGDTTVAIELPSMADSLERSHLRILSYDKSERAQDHFLPLEYGHVITETNRLKRTDKHSYIMYFMMVDRFNDAVTSNNRPVDNDSIAPLANYMGGDIRGITEKIDAGYFNALGVNTVWLSPIGKNPEGAWGLWDQGGVTSKFSGYHGYWPASSTGVDRRFGTEDDLTALIDRAHANDLNVLLDYVANHVHQDHPVITQHPDWATDLYLPDGRMNTELWDEQRLTTWFDTFLPTLDLENPEVADAMSDSALYWFENYEIDGFRHDATKHIPNNFWRTLYRKLKDRVIVPNNRTIYQIGETYGAPELINSYISSGMLDAQFDFNFYDAAIGAIANPAVPMEHLANTMEQSVATYGAHHLMGNISGNQDRPRFISLADGSVSFNEDAKMAGWTRDIEANGSIGYERLTLLHAVNMTSPGIPVIYYGDEYGMVGANDPDNRRMMKFDGFDRLEVSTLGKVKNLITMRRNSMALNYGTTTILYSDEESLVYLRSYLDQWVLVGIHAGPEVKEIAFEVPAYLGLEGVPESLTISQRGYKIELN